MVGAVRKVRKLVFAGQKSMLADSAEPLGLARAAWLVGLRCPPVSDSRPDIAPIVAMPVAAPIVPKWVEVLVRSPLLIEPAVSPFALGCSFSPENCY